MATRNVVGPVKDSSDTVVASGTLRIRLVYPIVDGDDFITPNYRDITITDGELPDPTAIFIPGFYEFGLYDLVGDKQWVFRVTVDEEVTDISVAELYALSRLQDASDPLSLDDIDLEILSSGDATDGQLLVADGSGGVSWMDLADITGFISDFTELGDTPASITADQFVVGNSGGTALEFTDDVIQAAGGTLTGALILRADAQTTPGAGEAVAKEYVDTNIASLLGKMPDYLLGVDDDISTVVQQVETGLGTTSALWLSDTVVRANKLEVGGAATQLTLELLAGFYDGAWIRMDTGQGIKAPSIQAFESDPNRYALSSSGLNVFSQGHDDVIPLLILAADRPNVNQLEIRDFGGDPVFTINKDGDVTADGLVYGSSVEGKTNVIFGGAKLHAGTGSPEGVLTADVGDLYSQSDGSTGTTFYIKETGTGNTGWVAVSAGGTENYLKIGDPVEAAFQFVNDINDNPTVLGISDTAALVAGPFHLGAAGRIVLDTYDDGSNDWLEMTVGEGYIIPKVQLNDSGGPKLTEDPLYGGLHVLNSAGNFETYVRAFGYFAHDDSGEFLGRSIGTLGNNKTFRIQSSTNQVHGGAGGDLVGVEIMTNPRIQRTSGTFAAVKIAPRYQIPSGTSACTDLLVNRNHLTYGNASTGEQLLLDLQLDSTSQFKVGVDGTVTSLGPLSITDASTGSVKLSVQAPASNVSNIMEIGDAGYAHMLMDQWGNVKVQGASFAMGTAYVNRLYEDSNRWLLHDTYWALGTSISGIRFATGAGYSTTPGFEITLAGSDPYYMDITAGDTYSAGIKFHFQNLPTSAPADGDLPNGFGAFWVDETANTIEAKVKYSNGTVKNLTTGLPLS